MMKTKKMNKEVEKLSKIVSDLLTDRVELQRQITDLSDKIQVLELQVVLDTICEEQSKQNNTKITGTIFKNLKFFDNHPIQHTINLYVGESRIWSYTGALAEIAKKVNYEKDNPCGYGGNFTPKNEIVAAIYAYLYNKEKGRARFVCNSDTTCAVTSPFATINAGIFSDGVADILSSTGSISFTNDKKEETSETADKTEPKPEPEKKKGRPRKK